VAAEVVVVQGGSSVLVLEAVLVVGD